MRFSTISACAVVLLLLIAPIRAQLMPPDQIPGKTYTTCDPTGPNGFDEDCMGGIDDLQFIEWDGLGNAWDGSDESAPIGPWDPDQVDALAGLQDALFEEVVTNQVPFVCSVEGDAMLYYHDTAGQVGVWVAPPTINAMSPPLDVDALELHDGAVLFSVKWDHLPVPTGNSIWWAGDGPGYLSHQAIQMALQAQDYIDVDAMMVFDIEGDMAFGPGDRLIFSLRPGVVVTVLGNTFVTDGGEIFVWDNGQAVTFLLHGGRVWDNANPVAQIFGTLSENIDALDAVPEDAPPPLPGDYNNDGSVTGADYVIWANTFGNSGLPGQDMRADGNGDGLISGADYVIWANNFGATR